MTISNRALLISSIIFAIVPLLLFWMIFEFASPGPIWGGLWFNPINVTAYLWLGITCAYWYRVRTKAALLLFLGFPAAFAGSIIMLLFRLAWTTQSFGH